jgi:hypothetical protein
MKMERHAVAGTACDSMCAPLGTYRELHTLARQKPQGVGPWRSQLENGYIFGELQPGHSRFDPLLGDLFGLIRFHGIDDEIALGGRRAQQKDPLSLLNLCQSEFVKASAIYLTAHQSRLAEAAGTTVAVVSKGDAGAERCFKEGLAGFRGEDSAAREQADIEAQRIIPPPDVPAATG